MSYTDIKQEGWITKIPSSWRPYILLMRLDRPVGWWLLFIPSLWGIMLGAGGVKNLSAHDILLMFYFWVGAILMRAAGCIINDLWDRDLDKKVERTQNRPIASGQISIRNAVIFLFALCAVSLVILLQMTPLSIFLGLGSVILVIAYPLMKRITYWPQLFLGITFNMGALIGYAAVTVTISAEAVILYVAGIFWTLGYDTVYALQDKEDDILAGIKSTALLFGQKAQPMIALFYAMTVMTLAVMLFVVQASIYSYLLLTLPLLHFFWQIKTLNIDDQSNALRRFQSNRIAGLLIFVVIGSIGLF